MRFFFHGCHCSLCVIAQRCESISLVPRPYSCKGGELSSQASKMFFTITAEIHASSLANFYCQYADRRMNLKFMRRVSEREPAIRQFVTHSYFDYVMTKFMINNRTDA